MPILILAEHDNKTLNPNILNVVTAGQAIGGDVHILVAGSGSAPVAEAAVKIDGVAKVLHADDPAYTHALAENLAALLVKVAGGSTAIFWRRLLSLGKISCPARRRGWTCRRFPT